jgi:hypothetical protein
MTQSHRLKNTNITTFNIIYTFQKSPNVLIPIIFVPIRESKTNFCTFWRIGLAFQVFFEKLQVVFRKRLEVFRKSQVFFPKSQVVFTQTSGLFLPLGAKKNTPDEPRTLIGDVILNLVCIVVPNAFFEKK